jgi:hypothetical protein
MPKAKSPTKIIEEGLVILGDLAKAEAKANVRVSRDRYDKNGGQLNEGGALRDSILSYPKGKKLTMSQFYYGKWQKPKKLGSVPWNPPSDPDSDLWENPMADAIQKHVPPVINIIAKNLVANILKNAGITNKKK